MNILQTKTHLSNKLIVRMRAHPLKMVWKHSSQGVCCSNSDCFRFVFRCCCHHYTLTFLSLSPLTWMELAPIQWKFAFAHGYFKYAYLYVCPCVCAYNNGCTLTNYYSCFMSASKLLSFSIFTCTRMCDLFWQTFTLLHHV